MSAKPQTAGWRQYFALNSSTGALLGAIVLVSLGSELWGPFLPKRMQNLGGGTWEMILAIAVYGSFRDLLEAINYFMGGWIAGRFNTRRGLLLFNAAPLVGLAVLMLWPSPAAMFVAVPFVFVWDSLAGPALLTVVGDSLPPDRRAMAFSLQSLFRRLSRVIAYTINSILVLLIGTTLGMQAAFATSFVVVLVGLFVQLRYMKTATQDSGTIIHRPLAVLRDFDPQLKRLLAADIFARLAEGMPRELIIIFVISLLMKALGLADEAAWSAFAMLLIVSQVTSAVTYIVMGHVASKPGLAKKPYIGWTFFFFASFPAVLALLGWLLGHGMLGGQQTLALVVLSVAFVFMGMREIGEPARKAMIVDLIPPAQKTQSIGIYWSARCVAVMLAPLVGGAIWLGTNAAFGVGLADATGPGPYAMLLASSLCGVAGVIYYYRRFGK